MTDFTDFGAAVEAGREQFIPEYDAQCRRPCISAQHTGIEGTAEYVRGPLADQRMVAHPAAGHGHAARSIGPSFGI